MLGNMASPIRSLVRHLLLELGIHTWVRYACRVGTSVCYNLPKYCTVPIL